MTEVTTSNSSCAHQWYFAAVIYKGSAERQPHPPTPCSRPTKKPKVEATTINPRALGCSQFFFAAAQGFSHSRLTIVERCDNPPILRVILSINNLVVMRHFGGVTQRAVRDRYARVASGSTFTENVAGAARPLII